MRKLNSNHGHKNKGFTLVEMIIYTSLFAIIFTIILQLFMQVNLTGTSVRSSNALFENANQSMEIATRMVREGESINKGASVFDSHPGILVIDDDINRTIETYTKNVSVGGLNTDIRKLRLTEGVSPSVDLTSDHVDVTNFLLTDLSPVGHPGVVQIEIEVSTVNPQNDPNFSDDISLRSTATIRKEQ